jgi:hypothetical protein
MAFLTFTLIAGLAVLYFTNEKFAAIVNAFIKKVFDAAKDYAQKFFAVISQAYQKVIAWFQGLKLDPTKHIPFMSTDPTIGDQIAGAAKISGYGDLFNRGEAFFSGVYNKETGEVIEGRANEIDGMDSETLNLLNKAREGNGYVVLQQ